MKKLILAKEATTADIENGNFIGVEWKHEGKSIVVRSTKNAFTSMSKRLDIFHNWESESKRRYAEKAISLNAEVYKFETFEEMIDWWKE